MKPQDEQLLKQAAATQRRVDATNETKNWHVNAIFNNRIVGDETARHFDKLHINGENRTIAVVYRTQDARSIVDDHNQRDRLKADRDALLDALKACLARFAEDGIQETHINHPIALARAAIEQAEKG